MFGMSSTEFWEDDPQLYWPYRTFYLKQKEVEIEQLKYDAWLKGSMDYIAVSTALNNAFSKQKANYPAYEELFDNKQQKQNEELTKKDVDRIAQEQFISWARY